MANYVCAELETLRNIYGGYDCANWVEVPDSSPQLLPELTRQEANEIGTAIVGCLLFAWGWKQLQKAF